MDKLVFEDGDRIKVLRGKQISEDNFFIIFESDNKQFRINKRSIISVESQNEI